MGVFTEISGWIAGPVIMAVILGKYLDGKFGTTPWIFIGMTGIAFLVSMWNIWKAVKKYAETLKNNSWQQKDQQQKK